VYVYLWFHVEYSSIIKPSADADNPINDERPRYGVPDDGRVKVNTYGIQKTK
jgi:hypothetical protein